jgi:hypothetical protein
MKKQPPTPEHQKGTRRIFPTITEEQVRALDLIVEDMKARGEPYATASGAVGKALCHEAARRKLPGFPDPEPYTLTKPHAH